MYCILPTRSIYSCYCIFPTGGVVAALAYNKYIKKMLPRIPKFTTVLHSGMLFNVQSSRYDLQTFFDLHNIKGMSTLNILKFNSCDLVSLEYL